MRVVIDVRPLQEGSAIRGIGTYLINLLEHLSYIDGESEYLLLHSRGGPAVQFPCHAAFRRRDVYVDCLRGRFSLLNGLRDWLFLERDVTRLGADVVHFTAPINPRQFYDIGQLNRRAVATLYDLTPLICWQQVFRGRRILSLPLYVYLFRHLRVLAHIIAISNQTSTDITRYLGIPPTRISVTLLALPRDAAETTATLPHLPACADSEFLLYIGELSPTKNPDMLPRVLAELDKRHARRLPLLLLGRSSADTEAAQDLARRLGVADRFHVLGAVPGEVKSALLASPKCRALLFPSRYEGFGLPALEAMAYGVPVVASREGSLPEVVGDAGFLLPPDDAVAWAAQVERLLRDPQLSASLSASGRVRAASFDWTVTARQTLEVYRAIAARSNS